jgi:membrane-bound lytic murein transglycosylase D
MQDVFRERNLPVELTNMPFIESSFDYKAYSSVGAAGLWQFMRRTGLQYLRINSLIDERRDPVEATKAAARYLSEAYAKLGNWPLAITSYNHGVYGVARKVREAGTSNLVDLIEDPQKRWFGFASTNFYPEFLAAIEVYDEYSRYFPGLEVEPPLELTEVKISSPTSVGYISKKLGVDVETLRAVNYAVSERVWSGRSSLPPGYALKVPSKYRTAAAALRVPEQKIPSAVKAASAVYGGAAYRVRKGDTLGGIAKRHRVTVSSLKELNNLKSDRLVVGQSLIISQRQESGVEEAPSKQPEIRKRRTYKVKRGDNLWSIAKRHGVSVSHLKEANGMKKNELRAGQTLTVP